MSVIAAPPSARNSTVASSILWERARIADDDAESEQRPARPWPRAGHQLKTKCLPVALALSTQRRARETCWTTLGHVANAGPLRNEVRRRRPPATPGQRNSTMVPAGPGVLGPPSASSGLARRADGARSRRVGNDGARTAVSPARAVPAQGERQAQPCSTCFPVCAGVPWPRRARHRAPRADRRHVRPRHVVGHSSTVLPWPSAGRRPREAPATPGRASLVGWSRTRRGRVRRRPWRTTPGA